MATVQNGQILHDNQLGETQAYPDSQQVPAAQVEVAETQEDSVRQVPEDPSVATPSNTGEQVPGTPVDVIEKVTTSVEAMSWKDLQMMEKGHQYCQHCKMVVDVTSQKAIRKKTHKQLQCRECHNIVTLLYRNWDISKLEGFKTLPSDEAWVHKTCFLL